MPATGNEPLKLSQFKSWITDKLSGFLAKPAQGGSAGDVLTLDEGGQVVWSQETSGTAFKVVDVEISSTQGFNIAPNYCITSSVEQTARIGYVEYPNHIEIKFAKTNYSYNSPLILNSKYDASTLPIKMYFSSPKTGEAIYGLLYMSGTGNKYVTATSYKVYEGSNIQGYSSYIKFDDGLLANIYSYTHFVNLVFEK